MDMEEDLFDRRKHEKPTDDEKSSYQDSVKRTSPLKSVDVDETFVVSSVIGKSISHEEKLTLLDKKPCTAFLSKKKKKIGKRGRYYSVGLFHRKDGSKRSSLTYSLNNDALYCIPCLLFSDEVLRGEGQRKNQGNAFIKAGFSNWKKHFQYVRMHEETQSHINSKIAQEMFLQKKSMRDILEAREKVQEEIMKRHVEGNRKILKGVIDTVIFLGKQELAFRGHRESLANDSSDICCSLAHFFLVTRTFYHPITTTPIFIPF